MAKFRGFVMSAKELAASLNMPKTRFPIRSDMHSVEERFRKTISSEMYQRQEIERQDADEFYVLDGPPFANGNLHIGHALNKVLKDIILRYNQIRGKRIRYQPGWDCHGLPIEMKVLQSGSKNAISVEELRGRCKLYADKAAETQLGDMGKWGLLFDPKLHYKTMDPEYEARQLLVFAEFVEKGLIYSALQPVYWSPSSMTALAEGELEYKDDHPVKTAYVGFPLDLNGQKVLALIWTTTPWTIPANALIGMNRDVEYCLYSSEDKIFLSSLKFATQGGYKIRQTFIGAELDGLAYERGKLVCADFVDVDCGTGLVHLAPAYGMEDFVECKKHGIEPLDILTDSGHYSESAPKGLQGKHIHSDHVIDYLNESFYVRFQDHKHRVPVDWRTKQPVIQRATKQIFVDISKIKTELLSALDKIQFFPESSKLRFAKMIESRNQWCISRQRKWGVPIPVFYRGNEPILERSIIEHVAEIVKTEGTNAWWTRTTIDLLPPHLNHFAAGLRKGTDTMDVWFDSGTAWTGHGMRCSELYLEGSDQFRGWFQSTLITSVVATGEPSTKRVISHGFVIDENGQKMSKSLGNVVAPHEVIEKYGIDGMRAWIASSDWTKDVSLGKDVLKSVSDSRQKIRNTCRFILGNLYDYTPEQNHKLWHIDATLLCRLNSLVKEITGYYEACQFHKIMASLTKFCSVDLSSFYFEVIKDRIYSEIPSSLARRSCQTVLFTTISTLTRLFAPILPFMAEEVFEALPRSRSKSRWPIELVDSEIKLPSFEELQELRTSVFAAVGKADKLAVTLGIPEIYFSIPVEQWRELVGVSQLALVPSNSFEIKSASPTTLTKCSRCWMYYSNQEGTLCPRCDTVLTQTLPNVNIV